MNPLDEKVDDALSLISRVLGRYKNPMLMSSFGKDSMVMLDLIKRMSRKLPIVFHREPFFPSKYEFANRIIQENDYAVYDYPPGATALIKKNGSTEIVNFYSVGKKPTYVPTGIRKPESGKPFLCGYRDLYLKPTGTFSFPWDVGFLGHKSSDLDPVFGPIPLAVDVKVNDGSCDYAFPLRWFTDADVWEYHRRFNVPINEKRYDSENDFRERDDITWNNDYFHACTLCIDRDEPSTVRCPLVGLEITNISSEVNYLEAERPSYLRALPLGPNGGQATQ